MVMMCLAGHLFAGAKARRGHKPNMRAVGDVLKGKKYVEKGRYQEAIAEFKKAIAKDPLYGAPYAQLGNTYLSLKRFEEAIPPLQQAADLDPTITWVHKDLGYAYGNLGRFQEAVREYRLWLPTNPNDGTSHYNLGYSYFQLGRYDEAIAEYRTALDLEPNDPNIRSNLEKALKAKQALAAPPAAAPPAQPPPSPPTIVLLEPSVATSGQTLEASANSLAVRGVAMDPSGLPLVTINGNPANMKPRNTQAVEFWSDPIALQPGENKFEIVASNAAHAQADFSFKVRLAAPPPPKAWKPAAANPVPMAKAEILQMLKSMPSGQVNALVRENGISFSPSADDLKEIREAGGGDDLIEILQQAGASR